MTEEARNSWCCKDLNKIFQCKATKFCPYGVNVLNMTLKIQLSFQIWQVNFFNQMHCPNFDLSKSRIKNRNANVGLLMGLNVFTAIRAKIGTIKNSSPFTMYRMSTTAKTVFEFNKKHKGFSWNLWNWKYEWTFKNVTFVPYAILFEPVDTLKICCAYAVSYHEEIHKDLKTSLNQNF